MGYPVFGPDLEVVDHIDPAGSVTIAELCELAGVPVPSISGADRRVVMCYLEEGDEPWVRVQTVAYKPAGCVAIGVPALDRTPATHARWALCTMAFTTIFDQVARATVRGQEWAKCDPDLFPLKRRTD